MNRKIEHDKFLKTGILVGIFVVIFIISAKSFYVGGFLNSDMLLYTACGKDIFSGNIFLNGWYGATNTFYLLSIIYGFVGLFVGYNVKLMAVVSALLFALMIVLIALIVLEINCEKGYEKYIKLSLIVAWTLASSYGVNNIYAGAHFDATIITILLFYIIAKNYTTERINLGEFVIAYFLLFLSYLSDSLTILYTILPVFLVLLFNVLSKNVEKKKKIYLIYNFSVTVVVFGLSKVVTNVWNGIYVPWSGTIETVGYEELFQRIAFTVEEIFYVFGGDFFSITLSIENLKYIVIAGVLVVFMFLILCQLKQIMKNLLSQFCIATITITILIMFFTKYVQFSDGIEYGKSGIEYSNRLFYFVFFCMLILISQIDFELITQKINIKMVTIQGIMLVCALYMFSCGAKTAVSQYAHKYDDNNKYARAAEYLEGIGAEKGFATFWIALPTTIVSEYAVDVTAIYGNSPEVFRWNTKMPEKMEFANFIIFDDSGWGEVTSQSLINSIGNPNHIEEIDDLHIYVWDKNIIPYIRRLNSEIKIYENASLYYSNESKVVDEYSLMSDGTTMYGPFDDIEAGSYIVAFIGQNLLNAEADVFSNNNTDSIKYEVISSSDNEIQMSFVALTDLTGMEYRLYNTTGEEIYIDKVIVKVDD